MRQRLSGKIKLLVVGSILASVLLAACAGGEGTTPADGTKPTVEVKNPDTFIQATIGDVDSLDPVYVYDTASGEQIQAIYEPLIWYDGASTSQFVPVLATEWTISPDGKTYRFKIRQGVKFHNGNDPTPEDVEN